MEESHLQMFPNTVHVERDYEFIMYGGYTVIQFWFESLDYKHIKFTFNNISY